MYFGWRRGSHVERLGVLLPPLIRGIPVFWLGILLLMAFSYGLNWFPNGGMRSIGTFVTSRWDLFFSWDFLWHLTLAVPLHDADVAARAHADHAQQPARNARARTISSWSTAKGVSEWVVLKHAARGSLLPVMTWVFHMFGYAIASTVVIEIVFAWPGLGREIVTAVNAYDYPLIQAAFFLISAIIITLNLIMDLLYGVLDPRVVIE